MFPTYTLTGGPFKILLLDLNLTARIGDPNIIILEILTL